MFLLCFIINQGQSYSVLFKQFCWSEQWEIRWTLECDDSLTSTTTSDVGIKDKRRMSIPREEVNVTPYISRPGESSHDLRKKTGKTTCGPTTNSVVRRTRTVPETRSVTPQTLRSSGRTPSRQEKVETVSLPGSVVRPLLPRPTWRLIMRSRNVWWYKLIHNVFPETISQGKLLYFKL